MHTEKVVNSSVPDSPAPESSNAVWGLNLSNPRTAEGETNAKVQNCRETKPTTRACSPSSRPRPCRTIHRTLYVFKTTPPVQFGCMVHRGYYPRADGRLRGTFVLALTQDPLPLILGVRDSDDDDVRDRWRYKSAAIVFHQEIWGSLNYGGDIVAAA